MRKLEGRAITDFEKVFTLIRYDQNSQDVLADAIGEVAAVLEVDQETAATLTKRCLDYYHYETTSLPHDIPFEVFAIINAILTPFRIPETVYRMAWPIERIGDMKAMRVLDYGGGGGKDAILFARVAASVTFVDFPDLSTRYVARRFEIRGLTNFEIHDVRRLADEPRYDFVNCMDVLEHVYDLEYVLADLIARMNVGAHLHCWPCFENHWDGDHIEKNCGYLPYFTEMLMEIGLEPVAPVRQDDFAQTRGLKHSPMQLYHLKRARPISGSVTEEREAIRNELYRLSQRYSARTMRWCAAALPFAKILRRNLVTTIEDNLFDNYAIRRLSTERLRSAPAS